MICDGLLNFAINLLSCWKVAMIWGVTCATDLVIVTIIKYPCRSPYRAHRNSQKRAYANIYSILKTIFYLYIKRSAKLRLFLVEIKQKCYSKNVIIFSDLYYYYKEFIKRWHFCYSKVCHFFSPIRGSKTQTFIRGYFRKSAKKFRLRAI